MKKVLITGAGTGFGHEVAMRLALKGFDVIAAVEVYGQVQTLKREAAARGATLHVEKLDVTSDGDRKKALAWNIEEQEGKRWPRHATGESAEVIRDEARDPRGQSDQGLTSNPRSPSRTTHGI